MVESVPQLPEMVESVSELPDMRDDGGLLRTSVFRDSKFVVTSHLCEWLTEDLPSSTVLDYVAQADQILVLSGAMAGQHRPSRIFICACLAHGLNMGSAQIKHMETDRNFATTAPLIRHLPIFNRMSFLEVIP
jgi:hypothetical protein